MSFGRQNYLFAHRSDLFFASKIIRELGGQECFFPIFFLLPWWWSSVVYEIPWQNVYLSLVTSIFSSVRDVFKPLVKYF